MRSFHNSGRIIAFIVVAFIALLGQAEVAVAWKCATLPKLAYGGEPKGGEFSPFADDFETDQLAKKWDVQRLLPHSYAYSDKFVKHGRQALLLTVHHGDKEESGNPGNPDDPCTERAEIGEPKALWPKIGSDLWYGFAIYLPVDLPPIDRRLVLAQIKQRITERGEVGIESSEERNPVLALRLRQIRGTETLCFSITPGNDDPTDKKHIAFVQIERRDAVGRWHNIVLHARIVPGDATESRAEWWFDDQPVPRITTLPIAIGYAEGPVSHFKMGPYRNQVKPNTDEVDVAWAFGYDEFGRDRSYDKAKPTPLANPRPLQPVEDCKKAFPWN